MSLKDLIDRAGEDLLYYKLRNGKLIEYELSETASKDLRNEFEEAMIEVDEIAQLKLEQAQANAELVQLIMAMSGGTK